MFGDIRQSGGRGEDHYVRRVARAFDRYRIGAVALVTLLLSLGPLSSSDLLEFFSPGEVAVLWGEHFAELAVLATALTIAYTVVDEALPRTSSPLRLTLSCAMLFGLSVVLTLLLHAYYAHGFEHLPLPRLLADSMRFGLPAVFLVLVADVHRRALQVDSAAYAAEFSRRQLRHDESEQQLLLLQAQMEPHFLFNVLGNVRRLYRTQPQAGAEMVVSLMRYLRAAVPQLRSQSASLGGELELVRAYLDLLQVRMGSRLTFSIESDPSLDHLEFPPMLLVTLVENAIKHGLEPVGGGSVCVRAQRRNNALHIAVTDNGAGLGGAASGGTGVGLANVRRQLAARYRSHARLTLEGCIPRGTSATIVIPLHARSANPTLDRRELAA